MPPWVRLPIAVLFFLPLGSLHAEVDGHALRKFQHEAEALNARQPDAHRYRAGFFYGYINGVLDALNHKSVCFSACRCELETLIDRHYRQHPEDLDQPAAPTLTKLFEQHYPCKKP